MLDVQRMIIEIMGSPIAKAMNRVFERVGVEGFPHALSMIILLSMCFVIGLYFKRTWAIRVRIDRANKELQDVANASDKNDKLADFEKLIDSKNDPLTFSWNNFKKSIVVHGQHEYLTIHPESYFNVNSLSLDVSLRRLAKWSGIFVGIGLLVTFLGLVAALDAATKAIDAATQSSAASSLGAVVDATIPQSATGSDVGNTTQEIQSAVRSLLSAASVKFYTSIFGLLASLIVVLVEKRSRCNFMEKIHSFCSIIQKLWPPITQEQLLADQVREAQQTTTQLKEFNSEMREGLVQLSGAMSKSLQENIGPVQVGIDQVGQNIGAMEGSITNTLENGLKTLLTDAAQTISSQAGQAVNDHAGAELARLVETLKHLEAALAKTENSLSSSSGNYASTIEVTLEMLQAGVKELTHVTQDIAKVLKEDIEKASTTMQEQQKAITSNMATEGAKAANQLATATNQVLTPMLTSFEALEKHVQHLSSTLVQSNNALEKHQHHVATAATTISSASTTLSNATLPVRQQVDRIDSSLQGLGKSINIMQESIRISQASIQQASMSLTSSWEKHLGRFEGVDAELAKALQTITENLDNNTLKISDFVKKIDEHLGKAVGQLAENIESLDDMFADHVAKLKEIQRR